MGIYPQPEKNRAETGRLGARPGSGRRSPAGARDSSLAKVPRGLRRVREHGDGNDQQFLGVETTSSGDDHRTGALHTPPQDAGMGLEMPVKWVTGTGRER